MSVAIAPLPNKASPNLNLLLQLNKALKKTVLSKHFYQEINDKILTKTSTLDSTLYFTCYFALLISSILNNKTKIKRFLNDQRIKLIRMIQARTNVDLSSTNNKWLKKLVDTTNSSIAIPETTSNLAGRLKGIYGYIADVRIFNRLFDTIKYTPWIIDEINSFMTPTSTPGMKFNRFVNVLQSLNCFLLEVLENLGWLTEHNWVGTNDNNYWCIETYIWCSRVWGAYIVIEILELFRRVPMKNWDKNWRLSLFKQAVQLPLVVHWSLYDGCLTPFWVGLFGSGASWWGFRDVWRTLEL